MLFGLFGGTQETRANPLENPSISLTSPQAVLALFGGNASFSGEAVTEEKALGVTAIWQAVNLIAGTIASLPLHVYDGREGTSTKKAVNSPVYPLLHSRANPEESGYTWRKRIAFRMLLAGRSISFIERDKAGRPVNLWPLDDKAGAIVVKRLGFERFYEQRRADGTVITYKASEVLDFNWLPTSDGLGNYNPIEMNRNAIGLIIAAERYAASLFENGGVPPLVMNGEIGSPGAMARAAKDVEEAVKRANAEKRKVMLSPPGYKIEPVGFDPAKQQVLELREFMVSEVARIFNVAPAMLHDLSHGTYSNVEQQNLSFTIHTIRPLVELMEQEINLKLFSDRNKNFAEFNLDGLMRGDFATRMTGLAQGVQNGLITPNEARALENRPPLEGGDKLYIQGATVPLESSGQNPAAPPAPEPTAEPEPEPTDDIEEDSNDD